MKKEYSEKYKQKKSFRLGSEGFLTVFVNPLSDSEKQNYDQTYLI